MTTRQRPGPPLAGTTVHVLGDVHAGGIHPWRWDAVARDANLGRMPDPSYIVQVGDTIDDLPSLTPLFRSYMDRLDGDWRALAGNHDVFSQTQAQWATSMGYTDASHIKDLPGLRLVLWSAPEQWVNYNVISPARLAWLDSAIGGTTNPVIVFCHFPLYDTVSGVVGIDSTSTEAWAFIKTAANPGSSEDVLDVLAAHDNVVAWVAGHTHSRIEVPGLVMPVVHAGHRFASINVSACWWTSGPTPGAVENVINTAYLTWLDDKIEVRFRDHGAGQWATPNGNPVLTVTGL